MIQKSKGTVSLLVDEQWNISAMLAKALLSSLLSGAEHDIWNCYSVLFWSPAGVSLILPHSVQVSSVQWWVTRASLSPLPASLPCSFSTLRYERNAKPRPSYALLPWRVQPSLCIIARVIFVKHMHNLVIPFKSLYYRSPPFTTKSTLLAWHKSLFLSWLQSTFPASSPAF